LSTRRILSGRPYGAGCGWSTRNFFPMVLMQLTSFIRNYTSGEQKLVYYVKPKRRRESLYSCTHLCYTHMRNVPRMSLLLHCSLLFKHLYGKPFFFLQTKILQFFMVKKFLPFTFYQSRLFSLQKFSKKIYK
jgi:hypothetical protein